MLISAVLRGMDSSTLTPSATVPPLMGLGILGGGMLGRGGEFSSVLVRVVCREEDVAVVGAGTADCAVSRGSAGSTGALAGGWGKDWKWVD